jgi:hypothetical protein
VIGCILVFVPHVGKPSSFKIEIRAVAYHPLCLVELLPCLVILLSHPEAGCLPPSVSDAAGILLDQRSESFSCVVEAPLLIGDISEFAL